MGKELKSNLPHLCLSCDEEGDIWELKREEVEEEYRGKLFKVQGTVARCKCCGFTFVPFGAMDEIVYNTLKEYKRDLLRDKI